MTGMNPSRLNSSSSIQLMGNSRFSPPSHEGTKMAYFKKMIKTLSYFLHNHPLPW
jgi:hypothetical protein